MVLFSFQKKLNLQLGSHSEKKSKKSKLATCKVSWVICLKRSTWGYSDLKKNTNDVLHTSDTDTSKTGDSILTSLLFF